MRSWSLLLRLCLSAMALSGFVSAADLASAKRAYQQKDYATAFRELTPLAGQGNPDAQVILGKMYLKGQGVLNDPEQAIQWFKASGAQGNAEAQLFLGSIYLLPHKDIAQGVRWLRLAAEQGNQDAQLLLGRTYIEGVQELPRDPAQAEMWLWLAAKDNLPFYKGELVSAEKQMTLAQMTKGRALAAVWKPKPGLKPGDQLQSSGQSEQDAKPKS